MKYEDYTAEWWSECPATMDEINIEWRGGPAHHRKSDDSWWLRRQGVAATSRGEWSRQGVMVAVQVLANSEGELTSGEVDLLKWYARKPTPSLRPGRYDDVRRDIKPSEVETSPYVGPVSIDEVARVNSPPDERWFSMPWGPFTPARPPRAWRHNAPRHALNAEQYRSRIYPPDSTPTG